MRDCGHSRDRDRAITQDDLARLYTNQHRYDEALALLKDSLSVLKHTDGVESVDTGLCCLFIARVYRYQEQYDDAERYGQMAIDCYGANPVDPLPAALASDEHAVTLAFSAMENRDTAKALQAAALSDQCLYFLEETQGPKSKEALRSRENNRRLRQMVHPLVGSMLPPSASKPPNAERAMSTLLFVSHAYRDRDSLELLLQCLPDYVKPVIFGRLDGSRENPISERLAQGVLGADGMISINSEISNKSIWVATERDVAARARKHMWVFCPKSKKISEDRFVPRERRLTHLYHPCDRDDVNVAIRWLVDERGFVAHEDPKKLGEHSLPPMWSARAVDRDPLLMSVRSFGAVYLIFMSRRVLENAAVTRHVCEQVATHSGTTVVCWLDDPAKIGPESIPDEIKKAPADATCIFSARPTDAMFDRRDLDQLMATLVWVFYRGDAGGMLRALGSDIEMSP